MLISFSIDATQCLITELSFSISVTFPFLIPDEKIEYFAWT